MYTSRRIDDREILLKRQQKIYFQMSGAGHEAIGVAAGLALKPGYDWFYPYYRDRALCLALGVKPYDMFLQGVGAADDPSSGGRQMPSHWSYPELHIVTQSSPTGSQILQAVGCAEGGRYLARHPKAAEVPSLSDAPDYRQFKNVSFQGDEVTYVSLGDGTSSEGEFWEAMNAAALGKLPVIFCVEDNGYAISVPVEVQTAGGSISRLVSGFPEFPFRRSRRHRSRSQLRRIQRAAQLLPRGTRPGIRARARDPSVFALAVGRRAAVPSRCRARARRAARSGYAHADVPAARRHSRRQGNHQLEKEVEAELQVAVDRALEALPPAPGVGNELRVFARPRSDVGGVRNAGAVIRSRTPTARSRPAKTMADLITATLRDEMKRDERIVIFGEDVADCSREEYLKHKLVKGKGGVFKLTFGLQCEFGNDRVFNSPLAEAAIVGRATGMATRGLKPVVEIQFFDYIWPAMMQIRDELPRHPLALEQWILRARV